MDGAAVFSETEARNRKVIEDFVTTNGLRPDQVEYIGYTKDSMESAIEVLEKRLASEHCPDGIFAADDKCCPQIYTLVLEHGLTIPKDLKVVASVQNPEDGKLLRPGLTAYLVNSYQMGYNAAVKLIQIIQGGLPDEQLTYVPYSLLDRGSA